MFRTQNRIYSFNKRNCPAQLWFIFVHHMFRSLFGAAGRNYHGIRHNWTHLKDFSSVTTLEWKISIIHHTVSKKQQKSGRNFSSEKIILQLVQAAEEATEAARSPTYANSCTVLPNLAGKCQILHFFGFFAHCYAHCA